MRNINVVKYKKLLYRLQFYCKHNKKCISEMPEIIHKCKCKTDGTFEVDDVPISDFERGFRAGKHSAYNDVLREVNSMVTDAECDWNSVKVREDDYMFGGEKMFDENKSMIKEGITDIILDIFDEIDNDLCDIDMMGISGEYSAKEISDKIQKIRKKVRLWA